MHWPTRRIVAWPAQSGLLRLQQLARCSGQAVQPLRETAPAQKKRCAPVTLECAWVMAAAMLCFRSALSNPWG